MRRTTVPLLALLLIASLISPPAIAQDGETPLDGRYQQNGDAGGFLSIMPPGADGVLNAGETIAAQGGQYPPHYTDQTALYDNLIYEGGIQLDPEQPLGVTDGDLERFFKDGSFGGQDVVAIDVSACGDDVIAFRDTDFGVPHIYGQTREAAQCANGYATAEDRLFLMDLLRHIGYARMSEFLGASEANQAMDRGQLLVAPYAEEDYVQQEADLCESSDPDFMQVCADGQAYIAGVNHYVAAVRNNPALLPGEYPALQINPEDFILRDILAIGSLVGGIFGKGGGGEAANSMLMAALIEQHGPTEARAIFDDLKAANDPDASLTIQDSFPYMVHPNVDDTTTALLEPGSFVGAFDGDGPVLPFAFPGSDARAAGTPPRPATALGIVDGPFGPIDLRAPLGMSNAILATGDVTDSGVPVAVFGPQTGYFTPQLLTEFDIHAPGFDARGTAFAGTNIYVQLGRGNDYAWSATSASGDLVDEWALELCDPAGGDATIDSTGYLWDGTCAEIPILTHEQIAKPTAGGVPADPNPANIVVTLEIGRIPELNDAPVVGRALSTDGVPVAIAEQRSTFKAELVSAVGFMRINDPDFMTDGVESFNRAFDGIDFTFNWFYIDTEDIAYRHTCLCPIRQTDTDPDLLTWGGRGHQWTGDFLTPAQQPQSVNPPEGYYANWNNKQSNGFRSNDDTFKHHSTDRRDHLAVRMQMLVDSGRPITRGDMVNVMEDAGTVDTNGQEIYPLAVNSLMTGGVPASLSARAGELTAARALLVDWIAAGGHRRDLDRDGVYDHAAAVALGDVWVRPMVAAVMGDEVPLDMYPEGIEDHPRLGIGSAYNSGRLRFMPKDFRQVLGQAVREERNRTYCGGGDVTSCSQVLWESLAEALDLLASTPEGDPSCDFPSAYQFGSADQADWIYNADCDNIIQGAAGIVAAPPMRWVNRPTYQQVVEAGTITGRIAGAGRVQTSAAVSRNAFPEGAETVVVASAAGFADAVAGTPLAADRDAPLLLTDRGRLSPAAEREILRLGATTALVLGGTAAVNEAVLDRLGELEVAATRISGETRFATALAIAEELGQTERFVLANAGTFADALAAGPFAAADDRAILLTNAGDIPADVLAAIGAGDVVVAGGASAVSAVVLAEVTDGGATVERVSGPTRYATAAAFGAATVTAGSSAGLIFAVTGEDFPDALSAGAAAARTGGLLVLVQPDSLDNAPGSLALLRQADRIWFVGGTTPLPSALRQALERLI